MTNDERLQRLADELKHEYFKTELAVGRIVDHPEHGKVEILSGYFWDPTYGRLSNWWTWREVDSGKEHSGYGWM